MTTRDNDLVENWEAKRKQYEELVQKFQRGDINTEGLIVGLLDLGFSAAEIIAELDTLDPHNS